MSRHREETDFSEESILAEYEYKSEHEENNKGIEDEQSIKSNVRAQERGREEAGGRKYEFKGHECLSSNGHYFSTVNLFTEIFNSLGSQQKNIV